MRKSIFERDEINEDNVRSYKKNSTEETLRERKDSIPVYVIDIIL